MQHFKFIAHAVGLLRAVPAIFRARCFSILLGNDRAFSLASESIATIPGLLGQYARNAFYQNLLPRVGNDVHFGFMTLFSKTQTTLGNRVYLGRMCIIGLADIADDVMIADHVQILSGRHQHGNQPQASHTLRDNPLQFQKITIGSGAWIGAGAIIMADVGAGAIVGAGAVVVQPIAPMTKVAGVPARPISSVPSATNAAA